MPTCVPWPIDSACCDGWDDLEQPLKDRATELAWSTLRGLTGGRVGNCPVTMRPCLTAPCDVCNARWQPAIVGGQWVNHVCGTPACSCTRLCEIVFPGPIADVTEVMMDGIQLDPELFRVDNGNRLVRVDGQCWPSCQRMDCALTEPCTLGITYVPGVDPGPSGAWAAGVLSCEFAKACTGEKCRLPSSVTTIARQGVSMSFDAGMFSNGLVGIREVDAFILAVNPNKLKMPSTVWSPDVEWAGHRYQTWP